jgi:hypothetical protein
MLIRRIVASACALCLAVPAVGGAAAVARRRDRAPHMGV